MRKTISQQMSFGDGFIDASLYELDDELKKADELLSNTQLLKPFEEVFDEAVGRPGTPAGIYLRMMYLKFRWGLSYEEVEREVRERLPWRNLCHLSWMDGVPDATTLIKLNPRFGEERVKGLNKHLLKQLLKTRLIKPRRIRIDSTTLEAHLSYPQRCGSYAPGRKDADPHDSLFGSEDHPPRAGDQESPFQLESDGEGQSQKAQREGTKNPQESAQLAKPTVEESRKAYRGLSGSASNQPTQLKQKFVEQIELAQTILSQTEHKLQGKKSIPQRIVSFHDAEARAICKGKLNKPVEFGRTLQLVQDSSGVIVH
jgi:IS5 family transposase